MKTETWKDIEGYDGYQVSDLGRVKSLERYVSNRYGKRKVAEIILSASWNPNGDLKVNLSCEGKFETKQIQHLVVNAFLSDTPYSVKLKIRHINGNKKDNRVCNLEVVGVRKTSNFAGVYWYEPTEKWITKIRYKEKIIQLGSFHCEIEASKAYQKALESILDNTYIAPQKQITPQFAEVSLHIYLNEWIAQIVHGKKKIFLGLFNTEIEASEACQKNQTKLKEILNETEI